MIIAGADGCKDGWICLTRDPRTGEVTGRVYRDGQELILQAPRPAVLAIDIPIGLPDTGPRDCDLEARKILGARRSSVFPAPLRPVLSARTWEEACAMREAIEGKRVSKQLAAILPKIREIDGLLCGDTGDARGFVREVHPEVSFLAWSGKPLQYSKKKSLGRIERLQLIEAYFGSQDINRLRGGHDVAVDDVLDAFAALWTAGRISRGEASTLPTSPLRDSQDLPMEIVY